MHLRFVVRVTMGALCVLLIPAKPGLADAPEQESALLATPAPQQARQAVERSLTFLEKDARKWRKEHECATCHHGAMTVWAFSEAKNRGYAVNAESLAEMGQWTKARFVPPPNQSPDLRPGFNIPSMAAVYLTLASETNKDGIASEELHRIARHITDRQEADGAWPAPPPPNAPAPVFESRETMALWFYLALEPDAQANPPDSSPARTSRDRAAAWLKKIEPGDTTQTAALRLLVEVRAGDSPNRLRPEIARLLGRQNLDGGWSQVKALPSDAYATGLALYVLSLAGVKNDRAVSFLLASQKEDGSWPMTPRETLERKASKNPDPIVHIGSAWAAIGLVRSLPMVTAPASPRDTPRVGQTESTAGRFRPASSSR